MEWPELLLIDKPAGITSFDVIRRLRKQYTEKIGEKAPKLGHAGTLDPAASGLMLIGVGPGTKKLAEYIGLDKEYVAEILIGEKRSTGDMDGEVIEERAVPEIVGEEVTKVLESMLGTLCLPVSAYSAIKKDGVPMYKRAREAAKIGELVTLVPWRDMDVKGVELMSGPISAASCEGRLVENAGTKVVVQARFHVGSGTYIRSLAEELGKRLDDYPATLYSLRRTKVGDFDIEDAKPL